MGAVNFYLKKPEASTGKCLIYLKFKYQTKVLVFSFGQTIDPGKTLKDGSYQNWDAAKQRVRSNRTTTADGKHSLNDLLDNLENVLEKAYHEELKNGIPDPAVLKEHLTGFMKQNQKDENQPTLFKLIDRFISGEIKSKGKAKKGGTLKHYKVARTHLKGYEATTNERVDFDTINLDFFYKYVSYLSTERTTESVRRGKVVKVVSKPLSQNSINKQIAWIKTFMGEAIDLGYTTNIKYKSKKFFVSTQETDAVYLTEKELVHLFAHDFTANSRLERVRDLFVFGAHVGLRYSDYSKVRPENIVSIDGEKFLKINTQKTGEQVIIPCNPVVLQIFEKYQQNPNSLPKAYADQKFNEYIKEACQAAGMTEKGRLITKPDKELWQCISSHTARRSFATNLYLEGFPTIEIMKITGHRTEKNFLLYIKVSKLDAAKKLSAHMKKRWSEKLLKVA